MDLFVILMSLQDSAGIISLAGALIVVSVVIFLIATSAKSEDKTSAKHKVYKIRGRYFFGLVVVLIVLLFISLRLLPYPLFQNEADQVVTVVGRQWSWEMAPGASSEKPDKFSGKNEISLPVDKRIEFIVTSVDVNHNFAIYNSNGALLTQVQAMPGYNNELQYTFAQKGDYSILCLEYCGVAHQLMMGTIHIR